MGVGENIKKVRKEKGLTQKELGEKLGISQAAIGQFESKSSFKLETIKKIADVLNVNISELIGDSFIGSLKGDVYNQDTEEYEPQKGVWTDLSPREQILEYFNSLNYFGKIEAIRRMEELTEIKRYTDPDDDLPFEPSVDDALSRR